MAYKWLLLVWALLLAVGAVAAVPQLSIEPSVVNALQNRELTLSLNINTDYDVYGIQFDLVYDPSILELVDITEGTFLNQFASTYVVQRTSPGRLTYAITRTVVRNGVVGPGTVATVRFRTLRAGQSAVQLSNVKIADPSILPIEGVRIVNSVINVQGASTTTPPSSGERRHSSSGGSSETSPSTSIISSGTSGGAEADEQGSAEKQPAKQLSKIALKGAEREQEQPTTEESSEFARSVFPLFILIVAALGALAFAYKRLA